MARPHPALIELAAGRPVPEPPDVRQFCASATEHRMHGLVWREVEAGRLQLDEEWRSRLARQVLQVRLTQRRLRAHLVTIAEQMQALGVGLATFKGVTASERWYDSEGDRPCADIDLLVAPADRGRAREIVAALDPDNPLLGVIQAIVDHGALQSVDLWLPDGTAVDLHFDLLKYETRDRRPGMIWERTRPHPLAEGVSVRVLEPEIALAHLLLHLNKDRFRYLGQFVDVARLMEREPVDWDRFAAFVTAEGLETPIGLSLEVVCEVLGVPTPPHPTPDRWRAAVWRRLWSSDVRLRGREGFVRFRNRQRVMPLLARGRTLEGIGAYWKYLFPPGALMDYHFPETSGPYLWRNAWGRVKHWLARRRESAQLQPHGAPAAAHAGAPSPEDG